MQKIIRPLVIAAALVAFVPAVALAQSGAGAGAVTGAVTGAVVGGPIGAAVGAVIGAVIGAAVVPPPPQVLTYVTAQPAPTALTLQGNLVVGATIPNTVVLTPVPGSVYAAPAGATATTYSYGYINGHKVVVDNNTHAVVAIVG